MSLIRVGISACLLGKNVRFNGSNCHKKWLTKNLSKYFDYQVVCPEVAAGLGVPRKSIFLLENEEGLEHKLIMRDEGCSELSELLLNTSKKLLSQCHGISGFIVKRGSPSCGAGSAKLYNDKLNIKSHHEDGLFVRPIKQAFPHLPIEDEGRLNDAAIREHFIKRVSLYHNAQDMLKVAQSIADIEKFHVKNKMLLRLHNTKNQKRLGQLIACGQKELNFNELKHQYFELFVQSFNQIATPAQHYTLLQMCFRGINQHLSKIDREDIQDNLKAYLNQLVPLSTPMMMLRHYAKRYQQNFITQQSYLYPYPDELALMRDV